MNLPEIVGFVHDGFLFFERTSIELLLVGDLIVDETLDICQFVSFKHGDLTDLEGSSCGIVVVDVGCVVDHGGVDVGSRFPEGVEERKYEHRAQNAKHNVI